ncbi:MAG: hypothetical protein E7040_04575 [Lentisphaerae bacterium]|nr:hypothetical protein [Lentisphaerota bacterium]
MKKLLLSAAILLSGTMLSAMPFLSGKTAVIDGDLSDPVWKSLPWKGDFFELGTGKKAPVQSRFKTFNDGKYIYFAVECDEPAMAKIRKGKYSHGSALIWMNDSIELNLVPDSDKVLSYYKITVDTNDAFSDLFGQDDNTGKDKFLFNGGWNSSVKLKTKKYADKWTLEAAIPFGSMDYSEKHTDTWRVHVGRTRWAGGKVELSGSSPLPQKSHLMPKYFNKMKIGSFQAKKYLFDIEEFKGELIRKDGKQSYKISATVHNNSGSFKIFRLIGAMTNTKTGKTYQNSAVIKLQGSSYKNFSVIVPDVPNGEYTMYFDLATNRKAPVLQKRAYQNVSVLYIPMQLSLKRPAYRNNIYATMKDKTIEALIELREFSGIGIDVELKGNNFRQVRKIAKSTGKDIVTFDGSKLADGRYTLTASCVKDGKKLSTSLQIRVLPYRKGEVYLDTRGVPFVDGKEFLSYGWYASHGEANIRYNTHLNTARFASLKGAQESIRTQFKRRQMRSLVIPFQDLIPGWKWVVFKDPDTRKKGLTEEQKKKIREFVSVISQEEGLLGYYMADEPECRDNNPAWYEEARELIAEIDPYHPTFMLNWGIDGMRRYYKGCDILLPDCYPQYFEDGTTGKVRWRPSDYAKVATALRPAWMMPQASCWPDLAADKKTRGVAPDYHDQRSQAFQAIANNIKGINLYAYYDSQRFTEAIFGPPAIGDIFLAAAPYLLENSVPNGVQVKTAPAFNYFQTGLKLHNGKLCLIAINTSMQKLKVDFKMKKAFSGMLYTEGCAQAISVKNGVFSDTFAPNETKIYFSDKVIAQKLTPVSQTLKTIAEFKAARKKKGNLVGLGDIFSHEYQLYGNHQKKYGADTPIITCSSDVRFYMTGKTGSMYYLVDGLIKPNRPEYTWKPDNKDKNPFIQFQLRKKAPVKEVRLYSPKGNLQAGKVVINGKEYPFTNNGKKDVIIIPIKEKAMTDTVRIYCTKFSYAGNEQLDLASRLLTEVEIY